ncbi:hypothetical protein [Flavobacterium sp. 3HN19-14]|uniref:hypothetical protein n=1 Tax=Flavobacterium sp. 3HN19-14 TaxID=3448133 RepID=UPI003EDF909A
MSRKHQKLMFAVAGFLIITGLFVRSYILSRMDYQKSYHFVVHKIDTIKKKDYRLNDTFSSPNFSFGVWSKIKVGDSISKEANADRLYVYDQNKKLKDSIKKTSIFPSSILKK